MKKIQAFHDHLAVRTMTQTSLCENWPVITRSAEAHVTMTISGTLSSVTQKKIAQ